MDGSERHRDCRVNIHRGVSEGDLPWTESFLETGNLGF